MKANIANQDDYVRITARLPPEIHERLTRLADQHARSLNGELIALLQEAIQQGEPALGRYSEETHRPARGAQQQIEAYLAGVESGLQKEHVELLREYIRLEPPQRAALLAFLKKL